MNETVTERLQGPAKARGSFWLGKGWDWFIEDPGIYLLAGLIGSLVITFTQGILYGPAAVFLVAVASRRANRSAGYSGSDWSSRLQEDFAQALRHFLPAFLSGLLILLFSAVGLVFLIIPGIVIFSMYLFTFHFIVERGEDFWQAMESSRQIVARDYFGFALFTVLLAALNLLGVAFLYVGTFFTLMVTTLAVAAAFRDCTGEGFESEQPETPPAPPVVID